MRFPVLSTSISKRVFKYVFKCYRADIFHTVISVESQGRTAAVKPVFPMNRLCSQPIRSTQYLGGVIEELNLCRRKKNKQGAASQSESV